MSEPAQDPFNRFVDELSDGVGWRRIRGEGWADFVERLGETVAELPPRRRQAVLMLLFALVDELVSPDDVRDWMAGRDMDSDGAVDELIQWLRRFRPTVEDD